MNSAICLAADRLETKDKNQDGKPDTWHYFRKGSLYKKEYDRNFDGRPDFGIVIEGERLVEKEYDDNFDGKFEKKVKAPKQGSTGGILAAVPK